MLFLGVRIKLKNFLGTVNFCFGSITLSFGFHFATFSAFLGPAGLSLGSESSSKTFFEPTHIISQLWFWKYSPIVLVSVLPHFWTFWVLLGYFWNWDQVKKKFGTYLHSVTTFILEV